MTRWDDLFDSQGLHLSHVDVDMETGSLLVIPYDERARRGPKETAYLTVDTLEKFFMHFGLEFRDAADKLLPRSKPLRDLIEIQGNLVPLDYIEPLGSEQLDTAIGALRGFTLPGNNARARATVERIYHKDVCVNYGITLSLCEGSQPFAKHMSQSIGSRFNPVPQPDGSFFFALGNPFFAESDIGMRPEEEAEFAAWLLDAILMEYIPPEE